MIILGAMNELSVQAITDEMVELVDEQGKEIVFLDPSLPENSQKITGSKLSVFVDLDAEGKLCASLKRPDIVMGEIKALPVVDVTDVGIFLGWGLSHDLFLPHKNHRDPLSMGDRPLVMLIINPKGRVSATTEIYHQLETFGPYEMGQVVEGTVYEYSEDLKAYFVAIEGTYHGMIPTHEIKGQMIEIPSDHTFRIKRVRVDGKLDVTPRKKAYQERHDDADTLYEYIEAQGGEIGLHDKSSPKDIVQALKMSKASFKRAAGKLYKDGVIVIEKQGMRIAPKKDGSDDKR